MKNVKEIIKNRMNEMVERWNEHAMNTYDEFLSPHQVNLVIADSDEWGNRSDVGIHVLMPNELAMESALEKAFKDLFPNIIAYI